MRWLLLLALILAGCGEAKPKRSHKISASAGDVVVSKIGRRGIVINKPEYSETDHYTSYNVRASKDSDHIERWTDYEIDYIEAQ